jgi:serine/threonine-protein kinase
MIPGTPGARNLSDAVWSTVDDSIVYQQEMADYDVWIRRPGEEPRRLISSPAREIAARLSPDSRWLTYQSNESGRDEIYARPFPNVDEQRVTVSTAGGRAPVWSRDGREIFYLQGASLMSAGVRSEGGTLSVSKPEELFSGPFDVTQDMNFDVFPDGQHFVMVETDPDANPTKLNVVQHWDTEIARIAQSAGSR